MKQTSSSAYSIIKKKRDGLKLSQDEIDWFIKSLVSGEVADYQMSALLMAIYLNGLDHDETKYLTDAMLNSGKTLNFDDPLTVDKHSTGGIGDKTSFILAPVAMACGVKVPMIAGRGLGHTGGTIDKAESIHGLDMEISLDRFVELVKTKGAAIIGQTHEIAPADKKIYALRDVTATVESIELITASIMSKKIAEGPDSYVFDIKTGSGAFMKTLKRSRLLAKSLMETALRYDKNVMTCITDMSKPLGEKVGNSLEIIECVEILKGRGPQDLLEVCAELGAGMILLAGLAKNFTQAKKLFLQKIATGEGLKKFREIVVNQGGDPGFIEDYTKLPLAKNKFVIKSPRVGYISKMDCELIGLQVVKLGGGRTKAGEKIDHGVGIEVFRKPGDRLKIGDELATIWFNQGQEELVEDLKVEYLNKVIKMSKNRPTKKIPLIYEKKISISKKDK